jgi:hypothetical protein
MRTNEPITASDRSVVKRWWMENDEDQAITAPNFAFGLSNNL